VTTGGASGTAKVKITSDTVGEGSLAETEADEVSEEPAVEAPAEQSAEQTALVPVTEAVAEKPAKKAGKAVKKAVASGEIEVPGQDVLSDLVHEIENLK
jgi:hypothetical protein